MIERRKSELVKILMSGDLAGAREKVASLSTKDQHTGFVRVCVCGGGICVVLLRILAIL